MIVVALLLGAVVGAGVAWLVGRRRWEHRAASADAVDRRLADSVPGDEADTEIMRSLRSAVDRLEMGVVVCDSAATTTYQNLAARALDGTQGGVIVKHHLGQILRAVRDGEPMRRVVELQGPPKVTFSINARPVPDGGAVATIQDITERVRIDSMRTDFVANISHELKTPVGAIAVLAEMIVDERDAGTVSDLADRIVDESHRAVRTIDDLLELSRIEASGAVDDVVGLAELIDEAVERGRAVAAGRDIAVTSIEMTRPVRIRGDRAQLTSALGNIVENAVKYSNSGGTVQVRTRVGERWVELMVADQGVGIPARDLDRVFERFYRIDKARARETGGTGLGLAIVRHVMNNHGGDVTVSSQEGEGSTFVLRFPVRLIVDVNDADARPHGDGLDETPAADDREGAR